jgi:hypothetical protein
LISCNRGLHKFLEFSGLPRPLRGRNEPVRSSDEYLLSSDEY